MDEILLDATDTTQAIQSLCAWFKKEGAGKRVAVYCTEYDLYQLCDYIESLRQQLIAVANDTGAVNTVSMETMLSLCPDNIVVMSRFYQELMRRRLQRCGYKGVVVLPYRFDSEIGTLGLFAYHSSVDWHSDIQRLSTVLPITTSVKANEQPTDAIKTGKVRPATIRNILLIQPPFDVANARHKKSMPLGILYAAASLLKENPTLTIHIIDAHINNFSWNQVKAELNKHDFALVGISYWSAQSRNAYLISDYIRQTQSAYIIHGGVHATLSPQDALAHCDAIVPFEGERAFARLIAGLNAGQQLADIAGIWIPGRTRDTICEFVENLDDLPFPAWDLLPDITCYDPPMHVVGGRRFPIIGSRGCPFNCTFCSSPLFWQRKVRWRTPANIVDEMDEIFQRYRVDKFHFWDDNMVMNKPYIEGLSQELLNRNRSYLWCGLSRASDIVKQAALLPLMKRAGCIGIEIGVEAFDDQVSSQLLKGVSVGVIEQAVDALQQAGIVPLYTHMLFTPGETIASYATKEVFMCRLNEGTPEPYRSNSALGQLTTPHVQTAFFHEASKLGRVLWREPSDSYHHRVNFIPKSLLLDIPRRIVDVPPDPLVFLVNIIQGLHDWTERDMRNYLTCTRHLWAAIDGQLPLQALAEQVGRASTQTLKKTVVFCSLSIVGWSRIGAISGISG